MNAGPEEQKSSMLRSQLDQLLEKGGEGQREHGDKRVPGFQTPPVSGQANHKGARETLREKHTTEANGRLCDCSKEKP